MTSFNSCEFSPFFLQLIIPSSFWLIAGRMKMSSWLTGSALKQHVVASHRHASFTQSAVAAATPLGHQERHLLITQLSKTFLRAKSCCSFCFFATKSCCSFCSNTISSHVILHFRLDLKKKD